MYMSVILTMYNFTPIQKGKKTKPIIKGRLNNYYYHFIMIFFDC